MAAAFRNLRWWAFRLSKRGNSADEYEDAFAGDPGAGRFAVADGASEASFAGAWARALVEGWINTPGRPWRDLSWLQTQRERWALEVDPLPLPWYAEEKREQGAFATLVGLALWPPLGDEPARWSSLAIGDSCLFHARGIRCLSSFPLSASAEFDNQPHLLCSRAHAAERDGERAQGRWRPGDRFLLMTDALSQWFLRRTEARHNPLEAIDGLLAQETPADAFAAWVEERRTREGLRNDDVTLLVIDVSPAPPAAAEPPLPPPPGGTE